MTAHPHERQEVYALDTPVKQSGLARRKEHQEEEEEEEEEEEAKPCLDGGVFVFLHSRQDDDDDDDFLPNAKETLNALRRQKKNDGSDEYTIELQTVSSSPSVVNCSRVVVEVMNGGTKKDFTRRTEEARRALAHRVIAGRCTLMFGETSESLVLRVRKCECEQALLSGEEQSYRITHRTIIDVVNADGTSDGRLGVPSTNSSWSVDDQLVACDELLDALREAIVWPKQYEEIAKTIGASFPGGVLIHGPPGTGKTSAVHVTCKEASAEIGIDVRIFSLSAGDVFNNGAYVGDAERNVRNIFKKAREFCGSSAGGNKRSIILMDDIDAVAPRRTKNSSQHQNRVVAQILTLMDGAKQWAQSPVVIATTTRPNSIDPALRRPGRFDREIETSLPNANERSLILKLHLRNVPLDDNGNNFDYERDIETIAKNSKGYSGADLQSLCREAVTVAVKRSAMNAQIDNENNNDVKVRPSDFVEAASKVRATVIRNVASVTDVAKTSWNDVGGLFEVKKRLVRAIEWPLKKKNSFERLGIRPARGILLHGPPGGGKTTLARAAATASGATVFSLSAADVFSMYLGEGEKILTDAFLKARKASPAVLILDEIDGMSGSRGGGGGGGGGGEGEGSSSSGGSHDSAARVLSALLTEMDGLSSDSISTNSSSSSSSSSAVLVIATTNRLDALDPAITRPGRFDLILEVGTLKTPEERLDALCVHARAVSLAEDVNLQDISERTEGKTGADLRGIVREAALAALREDIGATSIRHEHFLKVLNK